MINVRLDQLEIKYLKELVVEALFYCRSTETLSERKQQDLLTALQKAEEQFNEEESPRAEQLILKDVHELADLWSSDRAKELTIINRAIRKGIANPGETIDKMVTEKKLIRYKTEKANFLSDPKGMKHPAWSP